MTRFSTILGCCLLLLSISVQAQQASHESRTLSYQGAIASSDGTSISGEREITVRFYSDADGHTLVWQDTYRAVVANGVFNLALGSGSQPLPASDVMSHPLWVGTQIGTAEEMRPLAPLSSSPFALSIADNSVTKEKMATDYVSSLSLNGQRISGRGADINLVTGDGINATVDPATNSLLLQAGATSLEGAKGGAVQGNTTISGSLTVTGTSFLGSSSAGVFVYSLGASQPVKSNASKMLVSGAIDLSNVSETDVSGILGVAHGGTGTTTAPVAGGVIYGASTSAYGSTAVGTSGQVLTSNGASAPTWQAGAFGLPSGAIVGFADNGTHAGFTDWGFSQTFGTNLWTTGLALPFGQNVMTSAVVGGKIYVIGGENGTFNNNQIYDPVANTWSTGAALPVGQWSMTSAVVGGKIYVIGGANGTFNNNQIYDPASDSWTTGVVLPIGEDDMTSATVSGKIYVIGGRFGTQNYNQIFTPSVNLYYYSKN